jgi:tRNA modification GTPase
MPEAPGEALKNRFTLLTPPGLGAIAVVRICGEGVSEFLQKHFSGKAVGGACVHGTLRDDQGTIDDPLVAMSTNGLSADLNLHGGAYVIEATCGLLTASGFLRIPATIPLAEISVADICSDDPLDREVASSMPSAITEPALRMLLAQPAAWKRWREVRDIPSEQIVADRCLWRLLHPPTVAIIGIPNVGKSTLANMLFGQKRSIVADVAGTTRDYVSAPANVDGLPIVLLDTPGQRQGADAIERSAIAASEAPIAAADLTLLVLDPTQSLRPEQVRLAEGHPRAMTVINKSDLPTVWRAEQAGEYAGAIRTNALSGGGITALRDAIRTFFSCGDLTPDRPRCWTDRQIQALRTL